jgi:hypothetical protein
LLAFFILSRKDMLLSVVLKSLLGICVTGNCVVVAAV